MKAPQSANLFADVKTMPKLDIDTALHRCATDLGHSPSRSEYERWRHRLDQPRSVYSDQRIALGRTWLDVLDEVGLERRQSGRTRSLKCGFRSSTLAERWVRPASTTTAAGGNTALLGGAA